VPAENLTRAAQAACPDEVELAAAYNERWEYAIALKEIENQMLEEDLPVRWGRVPAER
jgi:hypothetical protein